MQRQKWEKVTHWEEKAIYEGVGGMRESLKESRCLIYILWHRRRRLKRERKSDE